MFAVCQFLWYTVLVTQLNTFFKTVDVSFAKNVGLVFIRRLEAYELSDIRPCRVFLRGFGRAFFYSKRRCHPWKNSILNYLTNSRISSKN